MLLSETTKKIKQDIGEKEIPPMLDNTFWGNREIETQSLKKISVINKKISLIEKAIRRIVKSFISLNNFSDQLDGLEGNAPGAPKKGVSRVDETPVKPADWSFLGKLIAAGMVLFLGYKIVEYVVKHIISPIINGFTKVINSVIGIFAAATNGFISGFAMTIKAATNSVVSFINLSTELYYSAAIGLAKIHKSITGNTAEIEKQIEDLRKEKISTQAATTAAGKSVTTEIETEKNVAISAVTSTAAGAETAVTAAGTSVISAITPPPLPDIFAGIGGMISGGGAAPSTTGEGFGGAGATGEFIGPGVGETGSSKEAMDFFISKGYTPEQAAGIVGNLQAESGANLRTDAVGDQGRAYGIAQWHKDRRDTFKRVYGKDIKQAGFREQLEFIQWELTHKEGTAGEKRAGDLLRKTKTVEDAAIVVDKFYERSTGEARNQRIKNALALNAGRKNNTVIVVNNPPPKPPKKKPPTQKYAVVDSHDYFGTDDRNHIPLSLKHGT